jgi:hypothetical protein
MNRSTALFLTLIFFIFFFLIVYFGALVTFWSSLVFAVFISLIILNFFYPPNQATTDVADYSLILYIIVEILGIIILAIYVTQRTLSDCRLN